MRDSTTIVQILWILSLCSADVFQGPNPLAGVHYRARLCCAYLSFVPNVLRANETMMTRDVRKAMRGLFYMVAGLVAVASCTRKLEKEIDGDPVIIMRAMLYLFVTAAIPGWALRVETMLE